MPHRDVAIDGLEHSCIMLAQAKRVITLLE